MGELFRSGGSLKSTTRGCIGGGFFSHSAAQALKSSCWVALYLMKHSLRQASTRILWSAAGSYIGVYVLGELGEDGVLHVRLVGREGELGVLNDELDPKLGELARDGELKLEGRLGALKL